MTRICTLHGTALHGAAVCGECGPNRITLSALHTAEFHIADVAEYCEHLGAFIDRSQHRSNAAQLNYLARVGAFDKE